MPWWGGGSSDDVNEEPSDDIRRLIAENNSLKDFIASRDADVVKDACAGLGTDEDALISVLCARTKCQIEKIEEAFRTKYEKSLWSVLNPDLSGNYERMVKYALMSREEFIAHIIQDACSGLGTDESLLLEALTPASNDEIAAAKDFWEAKHDASLIDKINEEMSGRLRRLIIRLIKGERDESEEADEGLAEDQASKLHKAGVGKMFGTDDEVFISIIGRSSRAQLQLLKGVYENNHDMSLNRAIKKEFHGDLREALQGMLETPIDYYCTLIRKAAKGLGTDERTICRVLGGNSKGTIQAISERFAEKYDKTLVEVVNDELGGNFKKAVKVWIDPDADPTKGVEQRLIELMKDSRDPDERLQLLIQENENLKEYIVITDAREVRRACKGIGTDENLLIDILCSRTKSQVEKIDQVYREEYGMTLREQLDKDLGGNLQKFMVYTQMETDEFDALVMRDAMARLGTDEDMLINVLTTRTNADIEAAQTYYENRFDESLRDKLDSEMSGALQTLLMNLVNGERDESPEGDPDAAEAQADELHETRDPKKTYVHVLSKCSYAQAKCIAQVYEDKYGRSLAKTIMRKFSGDLEDALLALLFDPLENYARALKKAFRGLGTDEDMVCRVLGGNDKETCVAIAQRYEEKYDMPLAEALKNDLEGKFKRAAVKWVTPIDVDAGTAYLDTSTDDDAWGAEGETRYAEEEDEGIEETLAQEYEDSRKDDSFGFGFGFGWRELEEGEEEEDEDSRAAAQEAREEAMQADVRRARERLNRTRQVARERCRRHELQQEKKEFSEKVLATAEAAKEQVAAAMERYGSKMLPSLTVWGAWDPDLYVEHNNDVEDDAWEHYQSTGFDEGRLVRIDNECGAFVGCVDMGAYARRHEIDTSGVNREPPFELPLFGWNHFVEEGKDSGLEIPITQVVPIYLVGNFDPKRYSERYPDVRMMATPPRPGKFDDEGYMRLYPEVEELGVTPFEHFSENRRNKIVVRGRVGAPDRRWYKEQYGKHFKHFFNRGYKRGNAIMLKAEGMTPLSHYCKKGHPSGRMLPMRTSVGIFDGVFDMEAYAALNPESAESGMDPLEYYEAEGFAAGNKLPLARIVMRTVTTTTVESDLTPSDFEDTRGYFDDEDEETLDYECGGEDEDEDEEEEEEDEDEDDEE